MERKMLLVLVVACLMLDIGQAHRPQQNVHEMKMSKPVPSPKYVHDKLDKGQGLQMKFVNHRDNNKLKDCDDARLAGYTEMGLYRVWFNRTLSYEVYCNHTATTSSVLIQMRTNGNVNFNLGYTQYMNPFGNHDNYWGGLENIYRISTSGRYYLEVKLQDFQGNIGFSLYSYFYLHGSGDRYRLILGDRYKGNIVDDLSYNNNMQFGTFDEPDYYKCAHTQQAGWWYNYCSYALLNGQYYNGHYLPSGGLYNGIYWKDWRGYDYSLKSTSMTLWKLP